MSSYFAERVCSSRPVISFGTPRYDLGKLLILEGFKSLSLPRLEPHVYSEEEYRFHNEVIDRMLKRARGLGVKLVPAFEVVMDF